MYLALYVDDGLLICESSDPINKVLNYLKGNFQITAGCASEFLGMDRLKGTLKICQSAYIDKILNNFKMINAKSSSVPAEPGLYWCKSEKNEQNEFFPYREAVGSLLFLSRVCRPDIEYAVNYASQFLESCNHEH